MAKRIDGNAAALFARLAVDGVNNLDLSYTPPFGSPRDAVQRLQQVLAQPGPSADTCEG